MNNTDTTFFVLDDCIDAARTAAVSARKNAWEHRKAGDNAGYRKRIQDAAWYRQRARLWQQEANNERA